MSPDTSAMPLATPAVLGPGLLDAVGAAAGLAGDPKDWDAAGWTRALRAAEEHAVLSPLALILRDPEGIVLSEEIQGTLRQALLASAATSMIMEREIQRLGEAFRRDGVTALMLRGVPMSLRHWGHPGARKVGDIDLLVGEGALPASEGALRSCGYEPYRGMGELEMVYARPLGPGAPRRLQLLDLHWGLVPSGWGYRVSVPAMLERAPPPGQAGEGLRHLSPEDELLELVLHALRHGFRLRHALDAAAAGCGSALDWGAFTRLARWSRLDLPARITLELARSRLGAPVPREALAALPVPGSKRPLLRREQAAWPRRPAPEGPAVGHLRAALLLPGWGASLGLVAPANLRRYVHALARRRRPEPAPRLATAPARDRPETVRERLERAASRFIRYRGESMYPTLQDPQFLRLEPLDGRLPEVGDVIAYEVAREDRIRIHRVTARAGDTVTTRGDNNDQVDPEPVRASAMLGRVTAILRDGRQTRVAGGRAGRLQARWCRLRRRLQESAAGRLLQRAGPLLDRVDLPLPPALRPRPMLLPRPDGSPVILLAWRGRRVGRYDPGSRRWIVRLPFRLLASPRRLEEELDRLQSRRSDPGEEPP